MIGLGLGNSGKPSGEIRVGFRHGLVRYLGVTVGGAGVLGLAVGVIDLAQKQPQRFFDLLSKWGFVWLLSLVAMAFLWDLAKRGMGYLGRLADSFQETSIAINRIADRDDRDKDRMQSEIAFVGRRILTLSEEQKGAREQMREDHREVIALLSKVMPKGNGENNG